MVRVLARDGLLEATADPLGGNRRRLRLTPAGEQLVTGWGAGLEQRLAWLVERARVPYRTYFNHTKRLLAALDEQPPTLGPLAADDRAGRSMTAALPTRSDVTTAPDGTAIGYRTLGAGDGLLVIGGAWRSGRDYLPFAEALSAAFRVHVIDRRGRGDSGPQGSAYSIDREIDDLLAVQERTGARIVFGHSYGGLIALEAARSRQVFSDVFVYEPGVSVAGSIPLGWMRPYRERLMAGDPRGAFSEMVKGAGGAPPILERMPLWYVKLMLRLFIKEQQWRQIETLLEPALAEHEQVQALDAPTAVRY